jgi:hypothetical protein
VTHLRQRMLDELQRRNYSQRTATIYIHAVEDFAKYFHRSPERLGPSHIREYQVHLFRDRKLSPRTIQSRCSALRFLFVKTLRRPYLPDEIPFPKCPRKLPTVLSPEEVARLIESARNLMHRTIRGGWTIIAVFGHCLGPLFTRSSMSGFDVITEGIVSQRGLCATRRGIIMRLSMVTRSELRRRIARGETALREPTRNPGGDKR